MNMHDSYYHHISMHGYQYYSSQPSITNVGNSWKMWRTWNKMSNLMLSSVHGNALSVRHIPITINLNCDNKVKTTINVADE